LSVHRERATADLRRRRRGARCVHAANLTRVPSLLAPRASTLQNHVPLVLALEPDLRQAAILKRIIRDRVHAEIVVVDSLDAAIAAVDARMPDVILMTALLSPRDEGEIISHLRALSGAEHVQSHTIPQLASSTPDGEEEAPQGGLFGRLRRKKFEPIPGCDPLSFADEIGNFIARAAEMKAMAAASPVSASAKAASRASAPQQKRQSSAAGEFAAEDPDGDDSEPAVESAWADPFAWRPSGSSRKQGDKDKQPKKPREPLVTTAPLAFVAEEEEHRLAEEARRAEEAAEEAKIAAEADRERLEHER